MIPLERCAACGVHKDCGAISGLVRRFWCFVEKQFRRHDRPPCANKKKDSFSHHDCLMGCCDIMIFAVNLLQRIIVFPESEGMRLPHTIFQIGHTHLSDRDDPESLSCLFVVCKCMEATRLSSKSNMVCDFAVF
mmetsp:Transcript_22278/g.51385  ORF Transcript_22278/g.51385 Transcript_22278/m.51385 type:complete len:134 (-) Transcript_22278:218-619(-)